VIYGDIRVRPRRRLQPQGYKVCKKWRRSSPSLPWRSAPFPRASTTWTQGAKFGARHFYPKAAIPPGPCSSYAGVPMSDGSVHVRARRSGSLSRRSWAPTGPVASARERTQGGPDSPPTTQRPRSRGSGQGEALPPACAPAPTANNLLRLSSSSLLSFGSPFSDALRIAPKISSSLRDTSSPRHSRIASYAPGV
jgi:hypothetical protein